MNHVAWKTPVVFAANSAKEPSHQRLARTPTHRTSRSLHAVTDSRKPYDPETFQVEPVFSEAQRSKDAQFLHRMAIEVGDKVILLFLRDILWIQSKGDLICLHGQNADYDCRMTMADLQKKIDPRRLLRLHRNAIVNLDHAVEFSLPRNGNAFVHLSNGKALPISRTGRSALRYWLLSQSCFA